MKLYKYNWKNNEKRKTLYGRTCLLLKVGKKNSILIEFTDNNQKEIVSRNSIVLVKESNNLF
jgi:hypothetical protein